MGDESEGRRLARFFELSVDLLCVVGLDGSFKRLNPAWERALGYPLPELRARRWTDLVHPDDRERMRAAVEGAGATGTLFFENRYRCRDGQYRWLQWSAVRVPEEEALYAVARDVTAQKDAEARLRASEAFKTAILDSALDAIVTIDAEGRVVDFNASAERMLGHRAADVRGKPLIDVAVPPESQQAHRDELARWVASQRTGILVARVERVGLRADGTRFPKELTVTRPQAGPTLFAGFIRDLTDVKRAEEERRNLEAQLRQAQKMDAVGRLAGGVAHDFNNLLSVILGFTDLARGALPGDAVVRENLDEVKRAAERATTLVRQLLAFGRRQVLSPKLLDVNGVIVDLERILRGLAGEQIDLQLALAPDLRPVRADPSQLEQVVVNLAVNARDAMPDGGLLRIATSTATLDAAAIPAGSEARSGRYACITVEDSGKGMSDEVAARVFEPFFTTKPPGEGAGLGLAMVYGIVAQSGGFVRFATAAGKGTTFHVYLPNADSEADATAQGAERGEAARGGEEARAGETILLVEDEEAVRHLVRKILEQSGYKVLLARHGGEALEICRNTDQPIHLLLTDVVMPVLSGPELLRRAIALRPDMKLAMMSGYTDRPKVSGIPFIAKPFTPAELTRRIRELLDAELPVRSRR